MNFKFLFALSMITSFAPACATNTHHSSREISGAPSVPSRQFKQLTFSPNAPSAQDFSDPSLPTFLTPHHLSITGDGLLSWSGADDASAWQSFLNGDTPTWQPIILYHSDGQTPFDIPTWGEEGWDLTIENVGSPSPVVLTGAMTPQNGNVHAKWPDDNWSRRTYVFHLVGDRWVQSPDSLIFKPTTYGWVGHNYGHQFLTDDSGALWMFYERVSEDLNNSPYKTEIFMRQATTVTQVASDADEIQVFKIGDPPYPANVRQSGGFLAEGPRPFKVQLRGKTYYIVSFSSSDWNSNKYGINLLWSNEVTGPYKPLLTSDGKDLKNFGDAIASQHHLTWGPGRGNFFQDPHGKWWVIFNAIDKSTVAAAQSGPTPGGGPYRNLYLAPVRIGLNQDGSPLVEILESNN